MKCTDVSSGLTWQALNDLLTIDPEAGTFRWKQQRGGNARAGSLAGSIRPDGYIAIKFHRRLYLAHRLMWFYVHRRWPTADVDHANMNKSDNRIANLREATRSQNIANGLVRRDSSTQRRGVKPIGNRFMANVTKDGVRQYLGCYATPDEAHAAYSAAARQAHGEFART